MSWLKPNLATDVSCDNNTELHSFTAFLTVTETNNVDREIKSLSDLKEGDIVRGYVKNCSDCGVFVRY